MVRLRGILCMAVVLLLTGCGGDSAPKKEPVATMGNISEKVVLAVKRVNMDVLLPIEAPEANEKSVTIVLSDNIYLTGTRQGDAITELAVLGAPAGDSGETIRYLSWCMALVEMHEPGLQADLRQKILDQSGVLRGTAGDYTYNGWKYRFASGNGLVIFTVAPAS